MRDPVFALVNIFRLDSIGCKYELLMPDTDDYFLVVHKQITIGVAGSNTNLVSFIVRVPVYSPEYWTRRIQSLVGPATQHGVTGLAHALRDRRAHSPSALSGLRLCLVL